MGLVVNTLQPVPVGRRIVVRLIAPAGWYQLGGDPLEAVTTWHADIDPAGAWQIELPPSSSYDAPDTWYQVDEPGARHAAVVPDGPGPHQLHDITIDDPGAPACCPPPTAAGSQLTGRVDQLEDDVADHELRITTLETAGPGGGGSGPGGYRHLQPLPASVWQIPHNLGYRPNVTALDTDGGIVDYERIAHPTLNISEITFGGGLAVAGTADAS